MALPTPIFAAEEGWGLGDYGTSGEKPSGNATAEELLKNNAFFVGDGDEKILYLTFDVGYENGYMEQLLDVLKETEVPAAFFVTGRYIKRNPELIKRIVGEGHIIGNHTMNHPDMAAISSKEAFASELSQVEEVYKDLIGEEMPRYYRPPEGKYSESNLKMAAELGYSTVFWSIAYRDWYDNNQPTKQQAFDRMIPRIHPGAVILLHSTSKTNANILKDLITKYKEMGYEFKSLDELCKQQG